MPCYAVGIFPLKSVEIHGKRLNTTFIVPKSEGVAVVNGVSFINDSVKQPVVNTQQYVRAKFGFDESQMPIVDVIRMNVINDRSFRAAAEITATGEVVIATKDVIELKVAEYVSGQRRNFTVKANITETDYKRYQAMIQLLRKGMTVTCTGELIHIQEDTLVIKTIEASVIFGTKTEQGNKEPITVATAEDGDWWVTTTEEESGKVVQQKSVVQQVHTYLDHDMAGHSETKKRNNESPTGDHKKRQKH